MILFSAHSKQRTVVLPPYGCIDYGDVHVVPILWSPLAVEVIGRLFLAVGSACQRLGAFVLAWQRASELGSA